MINNSTSQSTNSSSIYLKKSELPKNISSFKNDVGYISTATLDTWLKNHSYLSKSEVNELIRKANLVVIDTVNKSYDEEAIGRLNNDIISIKGEIVSIKDKINEADTKYVSTSQAEGFAKKSDVRNISDRIDGVVESINNISVDIDTTNFATKDSIPTKVSDLENDVHYLTEHQSLKNYAKKSEVTSMLEDYVKRDEFNVPSIDGLASQDWVRNQGYITKLPSLKNYAKLSDIPDVSDFVKKNELPSQSLDGLASQEWVRSQGYLTKLPSLDKYVLKKDLPDMDEYLKKEDFENLPSIEGVATEEWVRNQGYLTEHQSLKNYAKKTDVSSILEDYVRRDEFDVPSIEGLASQDWVRSQNYLTKHQSLKNYALKKDLPNMEEYVRRDEFDVPSIDGLASQDWVRSQGYLTKLPSLDKYAKKTDLQVLEDYATQEWVLTQGFLTEGVDLGDYAKKSDVTNSLSGYAKKSDLNSYARKSSVYDKNTIDSTFITKDDAEKAYLNKEDAASTYMRKDIVYKDFLQIEDYRGLKDATVISDKYKSSTLDDLIATMNDTGLRNGFYIVEDQNVIIVKDNSIVSMFHDGVPQSVIMWKEEFDD